MAETGTIGGTHHLTMCVGPAPEDYDFHVRVLGLRSVKTELFGAERLLFAHPCGIPYAHVGDLTGDDRTPPEHGSMPAERGIRGAYGTTTSVRAVGEMDFFLHEGVRGELDQLEELDTVETMA